MKWLRPVHLWLAIWSMRTNANGRNNRNNQKRLICCGTYGGTNRSLSLDLGDELNENVVVVNNVTTSATPLMAAKLTINPFNCWTGSALKESFSWV
mmetsp:Transcript_5560/g.8170  ORF Transcript_5560/g.8170 Transcript_5560/m.8170 type:complete len:96 (-) Transcript_5560:704-991(-)